MVPVFVTAYKKTMGHEAYYSNRSSDRGGETYKGITRRWYPDWPGWIVIDSVSNKEDLPSIMPLNDMVQEFYLVEFWDKIKGYSLRNQDLADFLFDTAVITGVPDANKYLQEALNFCNRNGYIYNDLEVDGLTGLITLSALELMVGRGEVWAVTGYVLLRRGEDTMIDLRKNPTQEINGIGWVKRLNLFNDQKV